jgi:Flp pilus assembly pilin Flp
MSTSARRTRIAADEGATAVEYSILAAVVGVVLVAAGPLLVDAFLALLEMITGGMLGA